MQISLSQMLQYRQRRLYYNTISACVRACVRTYVYAYAQFNDNLFIQFSTWMPVFKIRHGFTVH